MPHPFLIGALVLGGAVATLRVVRERGRIQRMAEKLARDASKSDPDKGIPLVRDPDSGVYTPGKKS